MTGAPWDLQFQVSLTVSRTSREAKHYSALVILAQNL